MGVVGVVGFGYLVGWSESLSILKTVPYLSLANYGMSVIPLFLLMGSFCFYAGISQQLYHTVYKWLGQFRGGLAMATVGACASFAAVSGSSMATAGAMGTVALPEMKKYKYAASLATGCIAAGGTMGILIPPSITLIVYGLLTEQSIGKLFLAGIIPGILEAVFYIITISILCKRNPVLGPPGEKTSFEEKVVSLKGTWPVLGLFLLVMGGIYMGVFSPTEAGAIGAFGAFVFALAKRQLGRKNLSSALLETGKNTAMLLMILVGASIFGYFLSVSRLPFELSQIVAGLAVSRYIIFAAVLAVYLFLGCFMLPMPLVIVTIPVIFPLVLSLGFDPIWFGIIVVRICEIGQITPPVGLNIFVIRGVAKDVPIGTIYRGVIPFIIADIFHLAMLVAFPQLSLFLPNLMK
jgi:tripartite ATP-independent transporter DctM subunit